MQHWGYSSSIMDRIKRNCSLISSFAGVFLCVAFSAKALDSTPAEVRLVAPGLRPIHRPTVVIPADISYFNCPITLPDYCDESGRPAAGWSRKYIATRRFASDQSAWIYFRPSDVKRMVVWKGDGGDPALQIWPHGATLVIEVFKGHALVRSGADLVEIAVMSKSKMDQGPADPIYYTANWFFARFNPTGAPIITPAKVRECHQCHSIAYHLTGDLIFTRLP